VEMAAMRAAAGIALYMFALPVGDGPL